MNLKAFLLMIYLWVILLAIFTLFNGYHIIKWPFEAKFGCGFFMLATLMISHILLWKGGKND